jgi:hypothetical protein
MTIEPIAVIARSKLSLRTFSPDLLPVLVLPGFGSNRLKDPLGLNFKVHGSSAEDINPSLFEETVALGLEKWTRLTNLNASALSCNPVFLRAFHVTRIDRVSARFRSQVSNPDSSLNGSSPRRWIVAIRDDSCETVNGGAQSTCLRISRTERCVTRPIVSFVIASKTGSQQKFTMNLCLLFVKDAHEALRVDKNREGRRSAISSGMRSFV